MFHIWQLRQKLKLVRNDLTVFFPWEVGREWQVSAEEKAMVARSHGGGAGPGGHAAWVLGVGDAVCMVSADFMLLYPSSHPASSREGLAGSCSQICQVGRSCHPFLTLKGTKVETGPSLHTVGTWGAGPACSLSTRACQPRDLLSAPASTAWSRLGPGFSLPEHFPQAPHQLQPDRLAPRLCAAG